MPRRIAIALSSTLLAAVALGSENGSSGSPSFTSKVRSLVSGAGETVSANFRARGTVSQAAVTANDQAQSTNFRLAGAGISTVGSEFQTDAPLVFGILSNQAPTTGQPKTYGTAQGGESIRVVGANFTAPGAGGTLLLFGPTPIPTAMVTSNTTIDASTPPGKDFTGTPLGPIDVSVVNGNGGVELPNAFVYTPALVEVVPPVIGEVFQFVIAAPVASQVYLLLGLPTLAFNKVPPLQGALLLQLTSPPIGPLPLPAGQTPVQADVPLLPGLIGITVALQSIHLPVAPGAPGTFSNEIEVTVQ